MGAYRVGIVGLSWITSEQANQGSAPVLGLAAPHSHLSALAAIPSVTVVAGCDIVPDARTLFHQRWDEMWPGLKDYADYNEMIQNENLDLICVATPDHLHGDIVRTAAAAGIKMIFCEKPMSTDVADVDSMIAAIEQHGVAVNVNHTRRWNTSYVASREVLRSGAIGALTQINVQYGGERAMLWRNHSHFIDLICYFAEADPKWVIAELEAGFENYGTTYAGDGGRSASLEPGVNAYIAFANGVRAFLGGMKGAVPQVSVDLIGSTGRIRADDSSAVLLLSTENGLSTTPINGRGTKQGMQAAIEDLIAAHETGREPQSPPKEARKAAALIDGILASQAAGNARVDVG